MSNRDQFIAMYTPAAQRVATQLNVPVDGVLNHWGLETGWGKSVIPGTNNLGNIKDFSGGGIAATDNMTKSRDRYRQYNTVDDFATDYAKLIGTNPRYAAALNTNTAYDFANGLQRGGYAEDPNFARKVAGMPSQNYSPVLTNTAQRYGLTGGNLKSTQVAPEDMAALQKIQNDKRSMLPLALGAMMSSNRGMQNFGNRVYAEAMEGVDPYRIGKGVVLPSGQYLSEQSDLDILRQMQQAQKIEQSNVELAPADTVEGPGGVVKVDPNSPYRGLNNKQAEKVRVNVDKDADKTIDELTTAAKNQQDMLTTMKQFIALNEKNKTGGMYDSLTSDIPWMHTSDDMKTMIGYSNKLAPQNRVAGSGSTSDWEGKQYLAAGPNIGRSYNSNMQAMYANQALADAASARLQFYQDWRNTWGHTRGAEEAFQKQVLPGIQAKYEKLIKDQTPTPKGAPQVTNRPLQKSVNKATGGDQPLSAEEEAEYQRLVSKHRPGSN